MTRSPTPRPVSPALQAVLCLMLAGALGVAALVRNHRLQLQRVDLAGPVQAGEVRFRYPATWELQVSDHGAVILEPEHESDAARRIDIQHLPAVGFISPVELLVRRELLDAGEVFSESGAALLSEVRPLKFADYPGVCVSLTRQYVTARNAPLQHRRQTLACTVLPSGDAILIKLEGKGLADASDEHLVQRLARSISLPNAPDTDGAGRAPSPDARRLALDDGVKVLLPPGLTTYAWGDVFRTGRIAMTQDSPRWLAVELVPCMAPSGEADEASSTAFLALLGIRDPHLRWSRPKKLDAQTWVAERSGEAGAAFPVRAYLRTGPGGHALIAEFRWVPQARPPEPSPADPGAVWAALAPSIEFPPDGGDLRRLLVTGQDALRSLPSDAIEVLNTRPAEQWQWYHEITPTTSLALFRYDASPVYVGGDADFDRCPPLAAAGWETRNWRLSRDWGRYQYQAARNSGGLAFYFETRVEGAKVALKVRSGDATTTAEVDRSPLFVPGAVLPLVLGRLPPEPMILQTDMLPSPQTGSIAGILTLRLEPATDAPRTLADGQGPMICWSVRVNGSGQSSRWYFDRDKRLQSVSFAGKVHFHRLDQEAPATRPAPAATTRRRGD